MTLGWVILAAATWAAFRLQGTTLFVPAVLLVAVYFLTFGYTSRFGRARPLPLFGGYPRSVSLATSVNMVATVAVLGLLAYSFLIG